MISNYNNKYFDVLLQVIIMVIFIVFGPHFICRGSLVFFGYFFVNILILFVIFFLSREVSVSN